MNIAPPTMVLDEITDFLTTSPSPQRIIEFRLSEALEMRALELLNRNRDGSLTGEERAEMEEFMRLEHFMSLLKAKARLRLKAQA